MTQDGHLTFKLNTYLCTVDWNRKDDDKRDFVRAPLKTLSHWPKVTSSTAFLHNFSVTRFSQRDK